MFENIKKAWKEARGTRLEQELSDTFTRLQGAGPKLYAEIHKHLQPLYSKVKPKLFNMTPEGQIKAGKAFQDEARRKLDFDVGQGYALWIIGAWLESGHLPGAAAEKVHSFLDNFLSEMLAKFPEPIGQQESSDASQSDKLTFMDMLVMQISMQVGMGGVELDDFPSLAKQDDFVLGYLVGAADAVSRAEGKTTQAESFASILIALTHFFSKDDIGTLTKRIGALRNRPEFLSAMKSGGQDYFDFLNQKPAFSLAQYILQAKG